MEEPILDNGITLNGEKLVFTTKEDREYKVWLLHFYRPEINYNELSDDEIENIAKEVEPKHLERMANEERSKTENKVSAG